MHSQNNLRIIPEYVEVGAKLLGSIEIPTTVKDNSALEKFDFIPVSFKEALSLSKDSPLKQVNLAETLNKLKKHPTLPSYLAGQTLQLSFSYQELKSLDRVIDRFNLHEALGEHSMKLPFVGEIKISLS